MITKVVLDAGHGGIDPSTGKYTTAPSKMYAFNSREIAYEGVFNMQIAKLCAKYLTQLGVDVHWTRPMDSHVDMSLQERVSIANNIPNSLMWSIHNNAGGGTGAEVFTTRGFTMSDVIAQFVASNLKFGVPNVKLRTDLKDGDLDKEADFYVLRKTKGSAILTESHFFDNWNDYRLLKSPKHLDRISQLMALGVFNGLNVVNIRKHGYSVLLKDT